ncbi:MAG TPA: FG-GAP-like repeat-containing protein, partial [Polyangiaceae bacterium]|nr:FG-GAP-like repeat-containing protein [Polyangiaceae bacterium]
RDAPGAVFRALSVRGERFVERDVALPALAAEARVVPLDLNGDGLRDVIVLRPDPHDASSNVADVYASTGADLRLLAQLEGPDMHEVHVQWGYVVLDYDGDGREDLLVSTGANGWRLVREVGPGGATHLQVGAPPIPYSVPFDTPDRRFYRALDVDGDGDDDLLSVALGAERVDRNARDELRQDRLLWVRDGLRSPLDEARGEGRAETVRVDYDYAIDRSRWPGHDPARPTPYRHDPAACAPGPAQRALRCFAGEKRLVVHTWTGGNGAETLAHDFFYQDARFHRLGAGWLGFASRQIAEPARQRITELTYDNRAATPVPLPGRPVDRYPYVERFYTAGRPLTELSYTDPRWAGASADAAVSDVTFVSRAWRRAPAEGGATSYVYANLRHDYRYQITNFRAPAPHPFPLFGPFDPSAYVPLTHASHVALEPDAFGNLGRVVRDDGLVEETTAYAFANDAARWLLGLATSIEHTRRPLGPDAPPPQARRAGVVYRPGTPLPATIEWRDPDDASSTVTETRAYDAYGNLTSSDRVDPQGRRRQACFAYEPEGVFPGLTSRANGHETRLVYDRALGVPLAAVDPNGLAARWSYDPFGRVTRALAADGADTTVARTPVTVDDPTTAGVDPVRFTQVEVRASGAERRELWSAEGRLVRVEHRAFAGLFGATRVYDVTGRLVAASVPTLVDRAAPGHVTYAYDGVDRPTRVTGADGLTTSFAYEGLTTRATGEYTPGGTAAPPSVPLLRTSRLEHDARGRVVRSVDAHGQATTYAYGAFDHVRRVTDSAGHATVSTVDAWGRTRAVDDPDRGARTYTYTAFGQLETARDAKGQLTRFVYDGLGRPTERHDADGLTSWTYDDAPFGIGQPSGSQAPGGVERAFTYDGKGRLETSRLRASLGDDVLTF